MKIENFAGGFTLLELLLSIGILALIGLISLVSFINSRNVRDITTYGQNALSLLRVHLRTYEVIKSLQKSLQPVVIVI